MAKVTLNPYLFFDGQCREAMEFYKSIFGGEVEVSNYDDIPGSDDAMKGKVMHAALESDDIQLMASDSPLPDSLGKGKVSLSLSGFDEAKLRKFFEGLSQGGKVTSPLKTESWGDTFGMLTDKFDVDWMVNITVDKK
jgi:PhnB protein